MSLSEKEVKAVLHEAKKLIERREAQGALTKIRSVLKIDAKNYSALVLEGAALDQQGKAAMALQSYKKATSLSPKNQLAWKGIVSHFEKNGDKTHGDLIEAYKNLANIYELESDENKYIDSTLKFLGALQANEEFESCTKVLIRFVKSKGPHNRISTFAVSLLSQMKDLREDEEKLFIECLLDLHKIDGLKDENYQKLFRLLYRSGEYKILEITCRDLSPKFNSFYNPMDYLCRLYVEDNLSSEGVELIPTLIEKLFKLYPSSTFGHFAQGKLYVQTSLFIESISWLKQGSESNFHPQAVLLLIDSYEKIWDWDSVELYALKCLKDSKFLTFKNTLNSKLASALIHQNRSKEAKVIVLNELENSNEKDELLARAHYSEKDFIEFDKILKSLKEKGEKLSWRLELCEIIALNVDSKEKMNEELCAFSEKYGDNFDVLLSVGGELLKIDDYGKAIHIFQKCLGFTGYKKHPVLQMHLADMYREEGETETARSYLTSAYKILPSAQIGMRLSDLYFELGLNDLNKEHLRGASKKLKQSKSKWAWLRLGLLYLEINEPGEAVNALQSAIRTDYADCHVWETLAEAYYARGSFDSALKAFTQCLTLNAEPTYPKFRIGVIQAHLGEETQAVNTLSELADYTPALVELANTWLKIARKSFNEGLSITVVNAICSCIDNAVKVLNSVEQPLALTIITEAIILAGDLNIKTVFNLPESLVTRGSPHNKRIDVGLEELLRIGLKTANFILSESRTNQTISFHHFSLARIYYKLSTVFNLDVLSQATYHAKKSISLMQDNYIFWNMLGIISEAKGDKTLAQHALLKSIEINSAGNAVAWLNLGLLYREVHFIKAHPCFSEAQRFEPSYGPVWIGQGLVAEEVDQSEATDLYRHAAGLDETNIHANACYAYWVTKLLLSPQETKSPNYFYEIEHLDAVCVSLEKIALYNDRRPCVATWNIQGILQANSCLFDSALQSFNKGLVLSSSEEDRIVLEMNKIIVLVKLGRWGEVKELAQKIPKKTLRGTFRALAASALSSQKLDEFERAESYYSEMIDLCSTDSERSDVLISHGLLISKFTGLDEAKTLLFKGCELAKRPEGYTAMCSLALSTGDSRLAVSIVEKMQEKFSTKKWAHHVALLKSFCLVISGEEGQVALRSILSFIHKYPESGKLWRTLALHLINFCGDGTLARHAFLNASATGEEMTLPPIALTYLLEGNYKRGLKEAQRSLLSAPHSLQAQAVLIAALAFREGGLVEAVRLAEAVVKNQKCSNGNLHHIAIEEWLKSFILISTNA